MQEDKLNIKLVMIVTALYFISQIPIPTANAQMGPSNQSQGDALWHLPQFSEKGWFIHAHAGRVRACNMDGVSVIGEKNGPKCSKWN